MPCLLRIVRESRVVHSMYEGEVTVMDVLTQRKLMAEHPDFDPTFSLIIDLSNVQRIAMQAPDIQTIAHSATPLRPFAKHIIIAPRKDLFGIARMYQIMGEEAHPNTTVVETIEEAMALASN